MVVETIPIPTDRARATVPIEVRVEDLTAWPDQRFAVMLEYNSFNDQWYWWVDHIDTDTRLIPRSHATLEYNFGAFPYILFRFIDTSMTAEGVTAENLGSGVQLAVYPGPEGGSFHPDAGISEEEEYALLREEYERVLRKEPVVGDAGVRATGAPVATTDPDGTIVYEDETFDVPTMRTRIHQTSALFTSAGGSQPAQQAAAHLADALHRQATVNYRIEVPPIGQAATPPSNLPDTTTLEWWATNDPDTGTEYDWSLLLTDADLAPTPGYAYLPGPNAVLAGRPLDDPRSPLGITIEDAFVRQAQNVLRAFGHSRNVAESTVGVTGLGYLANADVPMYVETPLAPASDTATETVCGDAIDPRQDLFDREAQTGEQGFKTHELAYWDCTLTHLQTSPQTNGTPVELPGEYV